jgi:hypothetical protein
MWSWPRTPTTREGWPCPRWHTHELFLNHRTARALTIVWSTSRALRWWFAAASATTTSGITSSRYEGDRTRSQPETRPRTWAVINNGLELASKQGGKDAVTDFHMTCPLCGQTDPRRVEGNRHSTIPVMIHGVEEEIHTEIAPLISLLCELAVDTTGSCQDVSDPTNPDASVFSTGSLWQGPSHKVTWLLLSWVSFA